MLSVAACFILAIDLGQTTKTRNPPSSNIHYRIRVGASWSRFSRKLHVESWFGAHFWLWLCLQQLQTSTSNLELLSTNLTLHALVFFSWPGGTRGRWYCVVFPSLGDRWEQTSFEDVPWKNKKLEPPVTGILLKTDEDEAIWIFPFSHGCSIWICKKNIYILGDLPNFFEYM